MNPSVEVTPELMAGFLDEAPGYLSALEEGLLAFESQAQQGAIALRTEADHERMNEVFRAAHSLKGISASLGFQRIRDLTHLMESLFDQLRNGVRELYGNEVETLFSVVDTLRSLVDELSNDTTEPVAIEPSLQALELMLKAERLAGANAARPAGASEAEPARTAATAAASSQSHPPPTARATGGAGGDSGSGGHDGALLAQDPDLLQRFVEATEEEIDRLDQSLLELEQRPADAEIINVIFRCAHNIKGASGAVSCAAIQRFTHDMESALDRVRASELSLTAPLVSALFSAADQLRKALRAVRERAFDGLDDKLDHHLFTDWLGGAPREGAAATPGGGMLRVQIRFAENFSEAAIYACMIYNRLADIGELIRSEPDVFALDTEAVIRTVSYELRSECDPATIERIVRAYSVEDLKIELLGGGGLTGAAATPSATSNASEASAAPRSSSAAATTDVAEAMPVENGPMVTVAESDTRAAGGATDARTASGEAGGAKASDAANGGAKAGETLRVDLERLDQLMNLGGELVITKARFIEINRKLGGLFTRTNLGYLVDEVTDRVNRLRSDLEQLHSGGDVKRILGDMSDTLLHLTHEFGAVGTVVRQIHEAKPTMTAFGEAVHSLNRISEGMQKRIMQTRMVTIGPLFQRFRRVVRDICKATGKKVDLVLHGENTELDKRMIDELVDPLTHMVRNSVDHGIEAPADRIAAGKPETGKVVLDAFHRGRHICIEVRDDGRGISADKIKKKIIERDLATPAQVEQMSDQEAYQYIFRPGFSTAEKVTDLSGRGMGMDIVKTKIENINGAVMLDSKPGVGTTFTIQLPLTLAIINAMMVRVGSQAYAVPLEMVVEIIPVSLNAVQHIQGRSVIRVRDWVVPLALLEEVLSLGYSDQLTATRDNDQFTALILGSGNERLGLLVDQLIGQQDIVIKDVATNFRNIEGVAGASIMGDGSVSLILDIATVMNKFSARSGSHSWLAQRQTQKTVAPAGATA